PPERRDDGDSELRAHLIPDTVRICGDDAEDVLSPGQVREKGDPAVSGGDPVLVQPLPLLLELYVLRLDEAQPGVMDLEVVLSGSYFDWQAHIQFFAVEHDMLYYHGRRNVVERDSLRVDDRDAIKGGKPHAPIASLYCRRMPR